MNDTQSQISTLFVGKAFDSPYVLQSRRQLECKRTWKPATKCKKTTHLKNSHQTLAHYKYLMMVLDLANDPTVFWLLVNDVL